MVAPRPSAEGGRTRRCRRRVLILLDELMDYAMLLSEHRHIGAMPGEKAFLNNLLDAVDDVPRVAFVVVRFAPTSMRGVALGSGRLSDEVVAEIVQCGKPISSNHDESATCRIS